MVFGPPPARPTFRTNLAGALLYQNYGFFNRWIVKRGGAGDTDTSRNYVYTDWTAVDHFTREGIASGTRILGSVLLEFIGHCPLQRLLGLARPPRTETSRRPRLPATTRRPSPPE